MKATAFKTADHLKTQKDIVAYLNAALEDGEPAVLLEALRNVAQAKGGVNAEAKGSGEIKFLSLRLSECTLILSHAWRARRARRLAVGQGRRRQVRSGTSPRAVWPCPAGHRR